MHQGYSKKDEENEVAENVKFCEKERSKRTMIKHLCNLIMMNGW
jgi:hypothetical protein